ncbi:phospholipase D-like domain-containing protein [Terriglobus sp. RCC_193]|uniref:phospholipase D-like domain-containing protein n=1 Tax=Terriglobus sp. RCC_193 TaxID=3239218 RepID=UPI003525827E
MVQPEDGIEPILDALRKAKKSIQILIFRFDRSEIERALVEAVERGVAVQALIAFTNREEDKNLRKLEMRLLEYGVTVSHTADDLVRYHGKMFIVDRKELYVLAFNYTHLDITLSRSFGVAITTPSVVAEAIKLFECDEHRKQYTSTSRHLIVSPVNARKELMDFIQGAKKQILMYEMKISDPEFITLLRDKVSQGVEVRVIGRVSPKAYSLPFRLLPTRLHARLIIRDGKSAFLGSQSLRKLELEARREIGVTFENAPAIHRMMHVFEQDWERSQPMQDAVQPALELPVRRVAKIVAKHIHMKPMVEEVLERMLDRSGNDVPFQPDEVVQTVRDAFRDEVHDAVLLALRDMAQRAAQIQIEEETKVP